MKIELSLLAGVVFVLLGMLESCKDSETGDKVEAAGEATAAQTRDKKCGTFGADRASLGGTVRCLPDEGYEVELAVADVPVPPWDPHRFALPVVDALTAVGWHRSYYWPSSSYADAPAYLVDTLRRGDEAVSVSLGDSFRRVLVPKERPDNYTVTVRPLARRAFTLSKSSPASLRTDFVNARSIVTRKILRCSKKLAEAETTFTFQMSPGGAFAFSYESEFSPPHGVCTDAKCTWSMSGGDLVVKRGGRPLFHCENAKVAGADSSALSIACRDWLLLSCSHGSIPSRLYTVQVMDGGAGDEAVELVARAIASHPGRPPDPPYRHGKPHVMNGGTARTNRQQVEVLYRTQPAAFQGDDPDQNHPLAPHELDMRLSDIRGALEHSLQTDGIVLKAWDEAPAAVVVVVGGSVEAASDPADGSGSPVSTGKRAN